MWVAGDEGVWRVQQKAAAAGGSTATAEVTALPVQPGGSTTQHASDTVNKVAFLYFTPDLPSSSLSPPPTYTAITPRCFMSKSTTSVSEESP